MRNLIGVKKVTNNNFLYVPYAHHPLMKMLIEGAKHSAKRMPWDFKFYYILGSIGPLFLIDTIERYESQGGQVTWVPSPIVGEYFRDEAANSWNKKWFDTHDYVWGVVFVLLLVSVVFVLYKAW